MTSCATRHFIVPHYHINHGMLVRHVPKDEPTLVTWVGYTSLEKSSREAISAMLTEKYPGVQLSRHKFNHKNHSWAMESLAKSDVVLIWDQCYRTPRGKPPDPTWLYQCWNWKPAGRLTYALSLGLPVIAHNMYSSIREVIPAGTPLEFSLSDQSTVVAKLEALLGDAQLRRRLSAAALVAAAPYSRDAVLIKYIDAIRDILQE